MILRTSRLAALIIILFSAATFAWSMGPVEPELPDILVDTEWLATYYDHDNVVILDTGRSADAFAEGHVPGAVQFDRSIYYGEVDGVPGMFTGIDHVSEALRAAGVNNDSVVVLYDSGNGLWATRLFWTLELLGHTRVAVLDGGSSKWRAEDRETSRTSSTPRRGDFEPAYRPELVINGLDLASSLDNVTVIDARSEAEYLGEDIRAARGGHIPGAINVNWVLNNTGGDVTTFLPREELAEFYDATLGTDSEGTLVTHCQTGVRGAHTYFVLRLLGYEDVSLYDASWVEWGNSDFFTVEASN